MSSGSRSISSPRWPSTTRSTSSSSRRPKRFRSPTRLAAAGAAALSAAGAADAAFAEYLAAIAGTSARDDRLPGRAEPAAAARHQLRDPPGSRVQTTEQTLELRSGSCRDTTWLLVQLLRHLGLAARFVSGYLIQLSPDVKALDGPAGAEQRLHRPARLVRSYLPGAGWIGLDPTSGLARRRGAHSARLHAGTCQRGASHRRGRRMRGRRSSHAMSVRRIFESPRVTKPYTDEQWHAIVALGRRDRRATSRQRRPSDDGRRADVRVDRRPRRRRVEHGRRSARPSALLAADLLERLRRTSARMASCTSGRANGIRASSCRAGRWRATGARRRAGLAGRRADRGRAARRTATAPATPSGSCARSRQSRCHRRHVQRRLRRRLVLPVARTAAAGRTSIRSTRGSTTSWSAIACAACSRRDSTRSSAMRCRCGARRERRQRWERSVVPAQRADVSGSRATRRWAFGCRSTRCRGSERPATAIPPTSCDPFAPRAPLPIAGAGAAGDSCRAPEPRSEAPSPIFDGGRAASPGVAQMPPHAASRRPGIVRTALCAEARDGVLYVFMPPVAALEDYLELVAAIEATAARARYAGPARGLPAAVDPRSPASRSRRSRRHRGQRPAGAQLGRARRAHDDALRGGAAVAARHREVHARRPPHRHRRRQPLRARRTDGRRQPVPAPADLLRSLVAYWHNHPSLSYLFSGLFIGPTSQAPRVDEARNDSLYELEIAFTQLPPTGAAPRRRGSSIASSGICSST